MNLSEPGGTFISGNIISNEIEFQRVFPDVQKTKPYGAYVGVGPEQNFTYITSFKPPMAFIVDIRRGNLLLHLAYKALIERSADRLDFLSGLFARKRPSGVFLRPKSCSMRSERCLFRRIPHRRPYVQY